MSFGTIAGGVAVACGIGSRADAGLADVTARGELLPEPQKRPDVQSTRLTRLNASLLAAVEMLTIIWVAGSWLACHDLAVAGRLVAAIGTG